VVLWSVALTACGAAPQGKKKQMDWFYGKDIALQRAIDADDPAAVDQAVRNGANVNAKGLHGTTPLEWALGHFKKNAYKKLLELKADPNRRDEEKDNAMTLAVRAYKKDPDYLKLALAAGGDPNTRDAGGDPIIMRFMNDFDCSAIRLMKEAGTDINARTRSDDPLVLDAAIAEDWDVTWCLLQLGAQFDYANLPNNFYIAFKNPYATKPDSPLYSYKVKCYNFLKAHGVKLPDLATGK